LQIETKYQEIRDGNPEGATEVVVEYTYPDMFGFAEVRAVFDADDSFQLVGGRPISVLDLFRGMQVRMSRERIGTIRGNPHRRYNIPVAPLPDKDGLWSSRVIGLVKHTAHEVVEFRWAGQMVRVTPGHVVWSADRRGWVGAHELLPGELIRVAGNVVAPVEGVRRVAGLIEVFGIEVEYFHNYFVGTGDNAMLVHNGPEKVARPVVTSNMTAEELREALRRAASEPPFKGGKKIDGAELRQRLDALMAKHGVDADVEIELLGTNKRGYHSIEKETLAKGGEVYHARMRVRPGATEFEFLHEELHTVQAEAMGRAKYFQLSELEREQAVFDAMVKHEKWANFSAEERQFAVDYLYYQHGGNVSGFTPSPTNPFKR
jgi:hypothetical protein